MRGNDLSFHRSGRLADAAAVGSIIILFAVFAATLGNAAVFATLCTTATSTAEATIADVTTSVVTRSSRVEPSADEGSIRASPETAGRRSGRGRRMCTKASVWVGRPVP